MSIHFKQVKKLCRVFPVLLLLVLCPATGHSLDNDAWNTGLNFHFFPPGARALGMGGAFVGLADDATAAASNPAGLAQLQRMQMAIEGRYISTDSRSDSFSHPNPGIGRVRSTSDEDDIFEPSFGAFSTPVFNNLFNVAVFYNRPISFDVNKTKSYSGPPSQTTSSTEISLDEVGISLAKGFADGRLMLGFGLGAQFFNMESTELDTFQNAFNFSGKVDEDDIGFSYRVGILAKPIDNLRLGASYTHNDRFDTELQYLQRVGNVLVPFNIGTKFDVPDNFALGAAYNIRPNWVAVFEAKYVMYSELMNGFVVDTRYADEPFLSQKSDFDIDDAMEIHIGTEYVINAIPDIPIALRAGFFYEPAHDLEYKGASVIQRNLFDGGDERYHFTFGTGAVFFNHLQVDVGADITDESQNVGLSMVYQF